MVKIKKVKRLSFLSFLWDICPHLFFLLIDLLADYVGNTVRTQEYNYLGSGTAKEVAFEIKLGVTTWVLGYLKVLPNTLLWHGKIVTKGHKNGTMTIAWGLAVIEISILLLNDSTCFGFPFWVFTESGYTSLDSQSVEIMTDLHRFLIVGHRLSKILLWRCDRRNFSSTSHWTPNVLAEF